METTLTLAETDREELQEFVRVVTARHAEILERIILFGSGARGTLGKESDLDILVVLKRRSLKASKEIHRIATDLLLRYGRYLSVKTLSESMYRELQALETPFMLHISHDGKVLWKKG